MGKDKNLIWAGLFYGFFVTAAVYWLGSFLEVSGSLFVRILFAIGIGILASLVFLFSYLAGKKRDKDK